MCTHAPQKFTKNIRYRSGLQEIEGQTIKFRATLGRTSMTNWRTAGSRQKTLELKSIYTWDAPDHMIADHIWVKLNTFQNQEIINKLIGLETDNVKRIVFTGTVYPYSEPFYGRGFHRFHFRYSIKDIEVDETRPILETA